MSNPTYVFGAADAKLRPLTSDQGSAPVYGTAIDVPGLKSISISGSSSTKELRGDHRTLAKVSVLESVEVTLEFAKWDPEIYAIVTGAVNTPGTDGSYEVVLSSNSQPGYFSVEAVSYAAEGAGSNVHIRLPKLIVTDLPDMVGHAEEDFKTVSIKCEALPLSSTGEHVVWGYNADAVAL